MKATRPFFWTQEMFLVESSFIVVIRICVAPPFVFSKKIAVGESAQILDVATKNLRGNDILT